MSLRTKRVSVPFGLIGKAVAVQAREGVVRITHRDHPVAEHCLCTGHHELVIKPEHGPGAVARNARTRYANRPQTAADPRQLDVEIRDLALYDTLADGVVEMQP